MREFPVTVIIPTYCTTEQSLVWLNECISSALATGAQAVVWDDGSPRREEVYGICDNYHIRYSGQDCNYGPSHARNKAVGLVDTSLFIPLDCDDYLHKDAVSIMYGDWLANGNKPVIPDVVKVFEDGTTKVHRLSEWSCTAQANVLAIAPVTVLQSVEQWKSLGGWNDEFSASDLYEDCEYNGRLFFRYCAVNCRYPLLYYRQHDTSRLHTRLQDTQAAMVMRKLRFGGGSEMACCGKGKKTVIQATLTQNNKAVIANMSTQNPDTMPSVKDGRILVRYMGGSGRLSHVYRGPKTKEAHKVMHLDYLYVYAEDAVDDESQLSKSLFVKVHKPDVKVDVKVDAADIIESKAETVIKNKRTARTKNKATKKPVK